MSTTGRFSYGTQASATITLTSLANGAGRVSTQIDLDDGNSNTPVALEVWMQWKAASGTAPTANNTVEVYMVRGNDSSDQMPFGVGTTDATITSGGTPTASEVRSAMEHIGTFLCRGDTDEEQSANFLVQNPPKRVSFYVYNDSGQAFSATAADMEFKYTPIELKIV